MSDSYINSPHDRFFRMLFGLRPYARDLLRRFLPPDVAGLFDFDTLVLIDGTYVDEDLRLQHSDLLFSVRLSDGRSGYIYVLLEHKSYFERTVPEQLLGYMSRIRARDVRKRFPRRLILPIVVYHGRSRWSFDLCGGGQARAF